MKARRYLVALILALSALSASQPLATSASAQGSIDASSEAIRASNSLIDIGLITSERARPDVPDDFASRRLYYAQQDLQSVYQRADEAGQGALVRRLAERDAARILDSQRVTPAIASFPDPVRVMNDVATRATESDNDEPAVAGAQEGRLTFLASFVLEVVGGGGGDRTPGDAARLSLVYRLHADEIKRRSEEEFAISGWCRWRGNCQFQRYRLFVARYWVSSEKLEELARLYFPREMAPEILRFAEPVDERNFQQPENQPWDWDMIFSILAGVVAVAGIAGLIWFLFYAGKGKKGSTTYGTADFAPQRDKLPAGQALYQGVFLGGSSYPGGKGTGAPIVTTPETHTLIVARTRTGKGTRVIIPTLALYTSSIFVIDPKGENAAITARFRRDAFKQTVHIINPWGQLAELFESYGFETATLNPLDVLKADDPNVVATARAIAETICGGISGKEQIWQASATALLTGLLLWVTDQPGETKTLDHVADLLTGGEDVSDIRSTLLPRMAASSSFRGAMRKQVSQFIRMAENTWTGVVFQLSQSLQFASDPRIHVATETSSFRLSEIVNGQTTIYIIIPDEQMQPQSVWLRLVISAITQTYKREKPAAHGIRGMFLIDEFPQMGRFESMVKDIAIMGGTGLDYALVVQSLSQIRELYDKGADTIIGNCSWRWFCNVGDLDTAQHVSTSLGPMTVQTVTQTVNDGDRVGGGHTYGETGRSLLFPDEIMALGRDIAIAFNPTERPHYLHPQDYWELPAYLNHFAGKSGLNFDYLNALDPNPYRPKDRSQGRRGGTNPPPPSGAMTRERALKLLALKEGATEAEVRAAYKRMMAKVHPDTGGNDEFAQTINQARDVLLK